MTAPAALPAAAASALLVRGLSKSFSGQSALSEVSLRVERGEIAALLGHNGSGKSTLVKCLAGFHRPDRFDEMSLYGEPIGPGELGADRGTLGFVHQDLGLIGDLSVMENFLMTALRERDVRRINWPAFRRRVEDALRRYEVDVPADASVSRLSQADRCLVAVVRAFDDLDRPGRGGDRLLVLDEPTPFLPAAGVERLFELMRRFRRSGGSIIFIAHDIDEVLAVSDTIAVLRDGRNAATFATSNAAREDVIEAIVGRRLNPHAIDRTPRVAAGTPYEVRDLTSQDLGGVSFSVAPSEIVGFTGLAGSGAADIPELVSGARAPLRGTLSGAGQAIELAGSSVNAQMRQGICLLPDDRLRKSGVADLPMGENIELPVLGRFAGAAGVDRRALAAHSAMVLEVSGARPADPHLPFGSFSGGNQQKALIAKWLALDPSLFLISEPTQGVDVGSRQAIYAAIETAARSGTAVVCYSSDAGELARLCDRVIVLAKGRIVATLSSAELSKDRISAATLMAADAGGGLLQ